MTHFSPGDDDTRELNPAQRNDHPSEIPTPEQQTGDGQKSDRDSEEKGKWDGETR